MFRIGPVDLTLDTLSPDTSATIPTVTDNAFSQGLISSNSVGISFEPTTSNTSDNGGLTFGGINESKFVGEITFIPVSKSSADLLFSTPSLRVSFQPQLLQRAHTGGIDESIIYGDTTILDTTAGIVDTGTTLLLIASDALQKYKSLTGAVEDETTGLLKLNVPQFTLLQSLFFRIGGVRLFTRIFHTIWP